MQAAVLEFDEAVQAPWRPRLCAEEVVERPRLRALPPPSPSRAATSRVGALGPEGSRVPVPTGPRTGGSNTGPRPRSAGVGRPPAAGRATGPGRVTPAHAVRGGCAHPAHRGASSGRVRLTARGRVLV